MDNLYACSPKKAKQYVKDCLETKLVPYLLSAPGLGKSEIVKQIADEYNLQLIDLRLSMLGPEDIQGLPHFVNGKAVFTPYSIFPLEGDPLPKGKEGTLLFLDEFNSAPRSVLAASYKIILDHMVGDYKLHERCVVVCAGNRMEDKAIVSNIGTALQNRLVTINMEPNFNDWLTEVALKEDYDERIVAYLNYSQDHLCTFDPNKDTSSFATPRSWSFVNRLIKDKKDMPKDYAQLLGGIISYEIASAFIQFCKIFNKLIKFEKILSHPDTCPLPDNNAGAWALLISLTNKVDNKNFANIATYINRFDLVHRIVFYRSVMQKKPELHSEPAYLDAMVDIAKYLVD